jgi:hypothetical protein
MEHHLSMQSEFLIRLDESVQAFVQKVEKEAGIEIVVVLDSRLNRGGPNGQGQLEVLISAHRVELFAPTSGYFPDGAVRHEVLHVHRFHIQGVPKLVLASAERWDKEFSGMLGALDNAIEHLAIVPVELELHPERKEHWEAVMRDVWSAFPFVPEGERHLAACLHWTFQRHALPNSPQIEIAEKYLIEYGLLGIANDFADRLLSVIDSKEKMIDFLFDKFPEKQKDRAALEYINGSAARARFHLN